MRSLTGTEARGVSFRTRGAGRFLALGWRPAEAGPVGFGSDSSPFALTARALSLGSRASAFGTG
jgi:hypothetical protein